VGIVTIGDRQARPVVNDRRAIVEPRTRKTID
jgi:hypothetical protein